MSPSDWRERLAPYLGSVMRFVLVNGTEAEGTLAGLGHMARLDDGDADSDRLVPLEHLAQAWVLVAGDDR